MTNSVPDISDAGTNEIAVEDRSTAPFVDWARPLCASADVLGEVKKLALFCRFPEMIDLARSIHCGDRASHTEFIILIVSGGVAYTVLERDDYDDVVFWLDVDEHRGKQVAEAFGRWRRTLDGAS